jgi:hypothetical protein
MNFKPEDVRAEKGKVYYAAPQPKKFPNFSSNFAAIPLAPSLPPQALVPKTRFFELPKTQQFSHH